MNNPTPGICLLKRSNSIQFNKYLLSACYVQGLPKPGKKKNCFSKSSILRRKIKLNTRFKFWFKQFRPLLEVPKSLPRMKVGPNTAELTQKTNLQSHFTMTNFLGHRLVHESIGSLATLLSAFELKGKTFSIGLRLKIPLKSLTQRILELAKEDLGDHQD